MLKIRHTGIYVNNLENMKNFYTQNFGMKVAVHAFEKGNYIDTVLGLKNIRLELYKLKFEDGTTIELIRREEEKQTEIRGNVYNIGCMHLAITVDNIDQTVKILQESGTKFLSEPMVSDDGKAKVCFCKDPEGNYLELVEEIAENERV